VSRLVVLAAALGTFLALATTAAASESAPTLAELETEVICPTCHTTLDQSSSPIAARMRTFIRARIAAGDTKSEIKGALVDEFGESVLASPPKKGFNLLAWVLPPAALVLGAAVLGILAVRWSRGRGVDEEAPTPALSPDVERRIDDELARFDA
jgi:cytochrome c-type biogenesis protein CcmH